MHMSMMDTICSGNDNQQWNHVNDMLFPTDAGLIGILFSVREALSDVELQVHAVSSMANPKTSPFQET